jgi:hypothetical protein
LSVRSSLPAAALINSASLSPVTAASPHRLVIFINVVGCGTRVPNGIRQNRCQEKAGGVWDDKQDACNEPTDKMDTRTLPGNIQLPPDLVNAPGVTKAPPRPIRVPSDIATVSTVSQGNESAS